MNEQTLRNGSAHGEKEESREKQRNREEERESRSRRELPVSCDYFPPPRTEPSPLSIPPDTFLPFPFPSAPVSVPPYATRTYIFALTPSLYTYIQMYTCISGGIYRPLVSCSLSRSLISRASRTLHRRLFLRRQPYEISTHPPDPSTASYTLLAIRNTATLKHTLRSPSSLARPPPKSSPPSPTSRTTPNGIFAPFSLLANSPPGARNDRRFRGWSVAGPIVGFNFLGDDA